MSTIYLVAIAVSMLIINGCSESGEFNLESQTVIEGRVSAKEKYCFKGCSHYIWVQDNKQTLKINVPYDFWIKYKVGDSCTTIIQRYERTISN